MAHTAKHIKMNMARVRNAWSLIFGNAMITGGTAQLE